MKQYTGTKVVNAKPMTLGEYNNFRGWRLPDNEDGSTQGYLVEYTDGGKPNVEGYVGYVSWSPKDVFEKSYQVSETQTDIMLIERNQLAEKRYKLCSFISSSKFGENSISSYQRCLLVMQQELMKNYLSILEERCNEDGFLMSFGMALEAIKCYMPVCREGWNGKGMFVVKQIPAHITEEVIPRMQSIPPSVKDILMARKNKVIDYTNQMLIIHPDGRADSWVPSSSDLFADDWMIYRP